MRSRILLAGVLAAPLVAVVGSAAQAEPTGGVPAQTSPAAQAPAGVPRVGEELRHDATVRYGATRSVVQQPGAKYVKVHFSSLKLAAGDYLTVADPARREVYTYHGDPTRGSDRRNSSHTVHGIAGFSAMSIDGDTAVVTLHTAARSNAATLDRQGYGARIDRLWRGYNDAEFAAKNVGLLAVCGADARRDTVCYQSSHPAEYAKSRAVAKLLIGGGGSCTTWRVGKTNRMLTNKHCFSTQSQVSASEMQFSYECATCGGSNPGAGTKVSGAQLLKVSTGSSSELDYTLYSVNNFDSITSFGTLFLETREATAGERIYIPGHGDGSPKRLSIFEETQNAATCTVKSAAFNSWNMSYSCDTSGGNSGSPVLAGSSNKVLALHHLGGCPNNQGARTALIYPQIKDLIDNDDGGTTPPGKRFENPTDVTINDQATVESSIAVSGVSGNAPATLKVEVNIKHTWRGDLVLSLVAPDGSVYLLEDFPNNDSADDVVKTYTVNASSEVANGTWKLRVQDVAAQDVGRIDLWAVTF